jgi:hypothetical protein
VAGRQDGLLGGQKIAADRGWAIGDRVASGTIYPDLELTVRAIYDGPDSTDKMLWFHYTYMDELLKNLPGRRRCRRGRIGQLGHEIAGSTGLVYVSRLGSACASAANRAAVRQFGCPVRAMTEQAFGRCLPG